MLLQSVVVIGYPTGGENTSVTSGVVSRVEVTQYVHRWAEGVQGIFVEQGAPSKLCPADPCVDCAILCLQQH